jgi:uncharacterized protein
LFLLDANILIALAWPAHSSHDVVKKWFAGHGGKGWASCPFTQSAFVRIISNPSFSRDALSATEALQLLQDNVARPAHQFWPADLPVSDALQGTASGLTGHQQITDAYLVALAMKHKGKLATLDRGILKFAPAGAVEVIE